MSGAESLVTSLKAAVQAAPSDVPLRRHLAGLLAESGDLEGAILHAAAALHSAPGDAESRALMLRLLDSGRHEEKTPSAPSSERTMPPRPAGLTLAGRPPVGSTPAAREGGAGEETPAGGRGLGRTYPRPTMLPNAAPVLSGEDPAHQPTPGPAGPGITGPGTGGPGGLGGLAPSVRPQPTAGISPVAQLTRQVGAHLPDLGRAAEAEPTHASSVRPQPDQPAGPEATAADETTSAVADAPTGPIVLRFPGDADHPPTGDEQWQPDARWSLYPPEEVPDAHPVAPTRLPAHPSVGESAEPASVNPPESSGPPAAGSPPAPVRSASAADVSSNPQGELPALPRWGPERVDVTLSDVGGMTSTKERLEAAVLAPTRTPELRRLYRKSLTGGVLLYGPPGCGKKFLARAVAGELRAAFVQICLVDLIEGEGLSDAQDLHDTFAAARAEPPVLLYLDGLDIVSRQRLQTARAARAIESILEELDAGPMTPGLYVLASAAAPWDVDSALRREGRFSRSLLVMPPDRPAREVILRQALESVGDPAAPLLDLTDIALLADGYSGVDLTDLVALAAQAAAEEDRPVEVADLRAAMTSIGPSTRAWLSQARAVAQLEPDEAVYPGLHAYLTTRRIL